MEIQYSEMDNGIRLIILNGRLDIVGTGKIGSKFAAYCAGDNVRLVVELSEVDFLASIGIHLLMHTAKSVASRGGRMVLLNPVPDIQSVLEVAGITAIIPIYSSLESAEAILMA